MTDANAAFQALADSFNSKAGKSGGIPACLHFRAESRQDDGIAVCMCVRTAEAKSGVRLADPWLMVFLHALAAQSGNAAVRQIRVSLDQPPSEMDLESLRRRLSYLALNNTWHIILDVAGREHELYRTWDALLVRPPSEIVRSGVNERRDNSDSHGKIEKNFQTWLAGEHRQNNERLAVLGEDFIFGPGDSRPLVVREFPTGAFDAHFRESARILPTYMLDFLTLNRYGQLALIELKVNDPKLEVISQALDYALFFACYRSQLAAMLTGSDELGVPVSAGTPIVCYIANNRFHRRFSEVAAFYVPRTGSRPFTFRKLVLGSTTELHQ